MCLSQILLSTLLVLTLFTFLRRCLNFLSAALQLPLTQLGFQDLLRVWIDMIKVHVNVKPCYRLLISDLVKWSNAECCRYGR